MFSLVDINNCYVSCERVFDLKLHNKPVVVLSNNDGCVIARSNEVKKLGVKMGEPAYQQEKFFEQNGVYVYSSNYQLYGDMSTRLMTTLQEFTPNMEVYSIDEAFLDLTGFEHLGLKDYGEKITSTVLQYTGLPVSMGIAKTKTLTKIANKFAKKFAGYHNVCMIDTEDKLKKALQLTDVNDVWGIGYRMTKRLNNQGIKTAYDFTQASQSFVRKHYTVTGERTWMELQGIKCFELEENPPVKKQICTSRAFPVAVTDYEELREAIATYASCCAAELRDQKTFAMSLMVFIHTNNFSNNDLQYWNNRVVQLPFSNNSTSQIVKHALAGLKDIFISGYKYKKAGVIITEISPVVQKNLFCDFNFEKDRRLMNVVDMYSKGFVKDDLKLAVQGTGERNWRLKQEHKSPCYTTDLNDVIRINCRI